MTSELFMFVGLGILVLILMLGILARMYRKAGPNEALVVYGFRGPRVIKGHGTVIFPMIENCRELSLELMSFDVAPQQDLYTKQGVAVTVEAVAQIKVRSDQASILTAAEQFLTKTPPQQEGLIRLVMEGHFRRHHPWPVDGGTDRERGRGRIGDRLPHDHADDMSKMGLEVISFSPRRSATRTSTSPTWDGLMWRAFVATQMWPRRKLSATRQSNAPMRSAKRPSRERRPIRIV